MRKQKSESKYAVGWSAACSRREDKCFLMMALVISQLDVRARQFFFLFILSIILRLFLEMSDR